MLAGVERQKQDLFVRALGQNDDDLRKTIKTESRAQTPKIFRDVIQQVRPEVGPRPGSIGKANVPNPTASALGAVFRVAGRAVVGASLVYDAIRITASSDKVRTAVQVGLGTAGAFGGGLLGATAGSAFLTPGVGTVVGGVAGAAAGGAAGEALGGRVFDFFFR